MKIKIPGENDFSKHLLNLNSWNSPMMISNKNFSSTKRKRININCEGEFCKMNVWGDVPDGVFSDKNGLYTVSALCKFKAWNLILGDKSCYDV